MEASWANTLPIWIGHPRERRRGRGRGRAMAQAPCRSGGHHPHGVLLFCRRYARRFGRDSTDSVVALSALSSFARSPCPVLFGLRITQGQVEMRRVFFFFIKRFLLFPSEKRVRSNRSPHERGAQRDGDLEGSLRNRKVWKSIPSPPGLVVTADFEVYRGWAFRD